MSAQKPVFLILFPQDWEHIALPQLRRRYENVDFESAGFDLFKFPGNARLMWFDPQTFVTKLRRRYKNREIAGVMSTHEQFGALCAAMLAEQCGLPGTNVEAILRAQHKAIARTLHAKAAPDAVPPFQLFTFGQDPVAQVSLPYPFFVKPVKAAYSVLARKIASPDELRAHTTFAPFEKHIIRRLTQPFNRIARARLATDIDGDYMMAESLMQGAQVNVDGFAFNGEITILGTIDAVMYPNTSAFMRFELPSRLSTRAIAECQRVAKIAIETLGFNHGLFNVELFWDDAAGQAKIIEVNPRMAAQFADLYEKVHGINLYDALAALSFGRHPQFVRGKGQYGAAASFVYRVFDDTQKYAPSQSQLADLRRRYVDAIFTPDFKYGASRGREQRWLGSHRYALLNLGGADHDDLMNRFASANALLDFDRPPRGWKGALHALRKSV
jgi:biotin carboxylase